MPSLLKQIRMTAVVLQSPNHHNGGRSADSLGGVQKSMSRTVSGTYFQPCAVNSEVDPSKKLWTGRSPV